jgi:Tol biopolymer transport system component
MNVDGSGRTVLGKGGAFDAPSHPSYAPDGRRILFQANAKGGTDTSVYTFSPDNGSDLDKVNKGDTQAFEPAYAPDSHSIVFRRGVNLFSMTVEGTEVDQLTNLDSADGANTQPSWSK